MNKSGDLNSPLGQLTSVPKKTAEQIVKEPVEVIEETQVQTGAKPVPTSTTSPQDDKSGNTAASNKTDILEVVKKMYEQSEHKVSTPSDETISKVIEENPQKTPEEIQKMAATRQQLWQQQHMTTYFEPTFNPPKKREEPRAAEVVAKQGEEEKKKQMEELQLQEKKKKELAPSVKQGTVESHPGTSG